MPRNPTLLSWILPLCVASAPVMSDGLDDVSGREAQSQWASEAAKPAIPLHRGPPADRPKFILQAQTSGTPSPAAGGAPPPGVPDDALKAEMEKRWGDAERIYKELLAKDPGRADLWLRLSDVLAVEGRRDEAAQALARAADLRPGDADVQFRASQAFGVIDSLADATRYNDRALALRPTDQALLRQRVQLATWANDFRLAIKTLKGLIDANPGDPTLKSALAEVGDRLLTLGRLRAAGGDIDGALDFIEQYRDAGGDEDTYRREVAEAREDRNAPLRAELEKRWDDAERLYRELLAKEPDNLNALQHIVGVLVEEGKRDEAAKFGEQLYRLQLEKGMDQVDALRQLAIVLAEQGKREEAAKALAQAADLRPDDPDLQQQVSQTFAAANQLADALRYIDRAIALRPDDTKLLHDRALLQTWSGKTTEAEKSLRALIEKDPRDVSLKRDLARLLMWQHKGLPEAAGLLSQYLAEHPDDKEALVDLGRIEVARGNQKAAADVLRRYQQAGGDEATYRRQLAQGVPPRPAGHPVARRGSAAQRVTAAAVTAPGTPLPPEIIKAILAKNSGEAERLIPALRAKEPNRAAPPSQLVD